MKQKFEFNGIEFNKVPKSKMVPYEDGSVIDLAYANYSTLKKSKQSIHLEKIGNSWIASIWNNKDWSIVKKSRKYLSYEKALKNVLERSNVKYVKENNKDVKNYFSMKLVDTKITIALIIAITSLVIFFSYHLFFSPMAQCVKSLQKDDYRMQDHIAKIACMSNFGIK